MHRRRYVGRWLAIIVAGLALVAARAPQDGPARRILIIVVDGLRPDYVTREAMPRLVRLGERGIVFTAHHSVVPTVTRVNGSSLVTGAYPETHGLLGNAIYIPSVSALTERLDNSRLDGEVPLTVTGEIPLAVRD